MRIFTWVAVGLALVAGVATCGGSSITQPGCIAGESAACVGPQGCTGYQTCQATSTFGPCICSAAPDGSSPSDGSVSDGSDGAVPEAADDVTVVDAGCSTWDAGLGGIGVPSGTKATASMSVTGQTPDMAIDHDLTTFWNAGGYGGSLTLTFPSPLTLDGIHLAANAAPATNETYTVFGVVGSTATQIGTFVQYVPTTAFGAVLAPLSVTPGTYDAIRIDVVGNGSWVAINEVSIQTAGCP